MIFTTKVNWFLIEDNYPKRTKHIKKLSCDSSATIEYVKNWRSQIVLKISEGGAYSFTTPCHQRATTSFLASLLGGSHVVHLLYMVYSRGVQTTARGLAAAVVNFWLSHSKFQKSNRLWPIHEFVFESFVYILVDFAHFYPLYICLYFRRRRYTVWEKMKHLLELQVQ